MKIGNAIQPGAQTSHSASAAAQQGGTAMPEGGKTRPPATADQIAAALIQINQFLTDSSRSLVFQVDTDSGRTVITVLNPATSEVIRTIPPTELIAMAEMLGKGQLRLVSDRA